MRAFILLTTFVIHSLASAGELTAVTRQLVRPVLIRNEHNSLLQLTINAKRPFVQVTSIDVSLRAVDNIESLQFYLTNDGGFSTEKARLALKRLSGRPCYRQSVEAVRPCVRPKRDADCTWE